MGCITFIERQTLEQGAELTLAFEAGPHFEPVATGADLAVSGLQNPGAQGVCINIGSAVVETLNAAENNIAPIRVRKAGDAKVGDVAVLAQLEEGAQGVLRFWLDEIGLKGWYVSRPRVDIEIGRRFYPLLTAAGAGRLEGWRREAQSALALVILLDQFPRNLFRDSARAFAYDAKALEVAKAAIDDGYDLATPAPQRQFFYMPFEHAEDMNSQDLAVSLFEERMPDAKETIFHAHAHRDLIMRFGRFPHRNAALGRENTSDENAFLSSGGYRPGAAQPNS